MLEKLIRLFRPLPCINKAPEITPEEEEAAYALWLRKRTRPYKTRSRMKETVPRKSKKSTGIFKGMI